MLVSIIIPVYNSDKYLDQAIQSCVSQTYKNIELIIVDDGSTDNSVAIAKKYTNNNHVKLVQQSNKGACAARNIGFEFSTGDYIQFLDADDILHPDKIECQICQIKDSDGVIASGKWKRFVDNIDEANFARRHFEKDWPDATDWLICALEGKEMMAQHAWLTPRYLIEKAGPWDERLKVNQDGEFFSRVLLQAKAIKYCEQAKVYYRSNNQGSVSTVLTEEKASSLLLSYKLYKQNIFTHEDSTRVRHALMSNFLSFIYRFYGKYPMLIQQAKDEIKDLGFLKLVPYGGKNFMKLAKFIGFENALKLRTFVKGV